VNAVLPLAFDNALYHRFKQRGLMYASAINSTGSLWALIPVHRMFPQAAVQCYFKGELELALQMVAAYKHCYDDPEYPDPRFKKGPIGQLSPTEPIGNGKNHAPGLMAAEALCRWIARGGATTKAAAVAEGDERQTVHCGLCRAEFLMSTRFEGHAPRCGECRASAVEWKQAWLTTVWFRSLGLSLGNKPHTRAPPALKTGARTALWALQVEIADSLGLPDFKIRAFVDALDDEQKEKAAPLLETFLYNLFAIVLKPLDECVHTGWTRTVQLAQWAFAVHRSLDDVMKSFETSCHAAVDVMYSGFHLPAVTQRGGLCELRDLPDETRVPLVVGMFSVFLNHDVRPKKAGAAEVKSHVNMRDVELGPKIEFAHVYDADMAADNPVIVVLGAGNHGKSTLLGATFASQMDPAVVEKYTEMMTKRGDAELAFAWLSDLSAHERYQGCTSKPHYWNFHTGARQCALIDVPGQAKYLKSAYIGMAAADAVIIVVSAVEEERKEALRRGGQAWNHLLATRTMVGISHFIVAITKMDRVAFSRAAFDEARQEVDHVIKHMGVKDVTYVPLSGLKSENIFEPCAAMPWTSEGDIPTLLEAIDRLRISREEQLPLPFRVMVDEVLKIRGVGPVVCGVVTSGTAKVGDEVVWDGEGSRRATIKSIEHFHKPAARCGAGDMVGLALSYAAGLSEDGRVVKGDVLGAPLAPPSYGDVLDLEVQVFGAKRAKAIAEGWRPVVVLGTCRVPAVLVRIAGQLTHGNAIVVDDGKVTMKSGNRYLIQLSLARAIPAEPFAAHARYSRAILMEGSVTAAAGRVKAVRLDPGRRK